MKLIVLASTILLPGGPQATTQEPDAAQRHEAFAELMTGCRMVGHFTDSNSKRPPQKDSYEIAKVTRIRGDVWRFDATIAYGQKKVTVPVPVTVKWAGDTPVIQVTKLKIPMLGTYSARVTIHGKRYAGMWSGDKHGGHMWGEIEPAPAAPRLDPEDGWTNWRGPKGLGIAPNSNPPIEWSEDKNVRWKVAIPGNGDSSPIILGDRVYVTTAIPVEEAPKPEAKEGEERFVDKDGKPLTGWRLRAAQRRARGGGRRGFGGRIPTKVHDFVVLAYDRKSGKEVWRTSVKKEVPHAGAHRTASQASNSPLTDGEHIYAHFGSRGIHCLDLAGKLVWSRDLGRMRTRNSFGEGSSPALHGNKLIVNWDHEDDSFVVALDKRTGKDIWRTERVEVSGWATPTIVKVGNRHQVIINGARKVRSYDLETGKEIWQSSGMTINVIPTPVHVDGVVYVMSGFRGAALQAIRLEGAKGDITGTDQVLWEHTRNTSYTPTPLVYDDKIYFLRVNSGTLSCLDRNTGEVHYEAKRLGMREVYSSPVGANKRVYITSRDGITKVLKLSGEYEELATNRLDDGFDATHAIVGDELYMRGNKYLYCIARQ